MDGDRLRKAAILIDTLDDRRADELLAQMPATQRVFIRHLVAELDDVTDVERETVIAEFLGPRAAREAMDEHAANFGGSGLNGPATPHQASTQAQQGSTQVEPVTNNRDFRSVSPASHSVPDAAATGSDVFLEFSAAAERDRAASATAGSPLVDDAANTQAPAYEQASTDPTPPSSGDRAMSGSLETAAAGPFSASSSAHNIGKAWAGSAMQPTDAGFRSDEATAAKATRRPAATDGASPLTRAAGTSLATQGHLDSQLDSPLPAGDGRAERVTAIDSAASSLALDGQATPYAPNAQPATMTATAQAAFEPWPAGLPARESTPQATSSEHTQRNAWDGETNRPFAFLRHQDIPQLVACLEFENPQATAIVMSRLAPELAAETVRQFAPPIRADVIRRLSTLHPVDPGVVQELEDYFRGRLSMSERPVHGLETRDGLRALQAIFDASSAAERRVMVEQLADEDEALAEHFAQRFGDSPADPPATVAADESPERPKPTMLAVEFNTGHTRTLGMEPPSSEIDNELPGKAPTEEATDDWFAPPTEETFAAWPAEEDFATNDVDRQDDQGVELSFSRQAQELADASAGEATQRPGGEAINEVDVEADQDFSVVTSLSHRQLAQLIQQTDPQLLLVALAGADERDVDNVLRHLSRQDARRVRERIAQLAPIRVADIEYAQRVLIEQAGELQDNPPASRWFEFWRRAK